MERKEHLTIPKTWAQQDEMPREISDTQGTLDFQNSTDCIGRRDLARQETDMEKSLTMPADPSSELHLLSMSQRKGLTPSKPTGLEFSQDAVHCAVALWEEPALSLAGLTVLGEEELAACAHTAACALRPKDGTRV